MNAIEQALDEQHDKLYSNFKKEVMTLLKDCQEDLSEEWQSIHSFTRSFEQFHEDLGKHDKKVFQPLLNSYKEDLVTTRKDLMVLAKLVNRLSHIAEGNEI